MLVQGYIWTSTGLIASAFLVLLVVFVKVKLEKFEEAGAYYNVDGDKATRQFTYHEFMKLPDHVRSALMYNKNITEWRKSEMERHGIRLVGEFQTRWGRLCYHAREWFLAFLG